MAAQRWLRTDAGPRLEAAERGPAIVAGHIPLVSDLGAPSSVEITSALVRGLPSGSGSLPARDYLSDACVASPTLAVATWCDLVQCCRQRGMQLLRYATAPPVRA